jgi:glutathione S-transferase
MLLIEAKQIPINVELINMRSYGDKPQSFLQKVPNGLLPALEVATVGKGRNQIITESGVIMELLDEWYPPSEGYKQMIPNPTTQSDHYNTYKELLVLERELFRWWCTVMFRPETPNSSSNNGNGIGGMIGGLLGGGAGAGGGGATKMSSAMEGFLLCFQRVNAALQSTKGPYFLDYTIHHPSMIDFVFASHVERMVASFAYWKGMNLRDAGSYPNFAGIQRWMDALEREEYYLAFKSDYYTHIKDIPPQYGPGYDGIMNHDTIVQYQGNIVGTGSSWKLPLPHDDMLQPLYRGPPLPLCVLKAMNIQPDIEDGTTTTGSSSSSSYEQCDPTTMRLACRGMAGWKLVHNGPNIATFASRGGPSGSKNIRKTFGAELADPYAAADPSIVPSVDLILRVVGFALLEDDTEQHQHQLLPHPRYVTMLQTVCMDFSPSQRGGVVASLAYLRDRIGVPRDLPFASARYLRAYLNWAIDIVLEQQE